MRDVVFFALGFLGGAVAVGLFGLRRTGRMQDQVTELHKYYDLYNTKCQNGKGMS